ncbi:HAMP domain-containing sensor histidine kinase [Bacillus sp. LL01]|uniref:sensor histidine kinase n=1 Tax=Bacillus sp. LL01 TaxID=1665556 RepID=UPI001F52B207|nr:HAMP domain-containing sensor histidine kinase [Bacillus sp. LL01]
MKSINRKSIFIKLFLTSLLILFVSFLLFAVIFNYLLHSVLFKNYQDSLYYQRDQLTSYINGVSGKVLDDNTFYSSLELSMHKEDQTTFIFGSDGKQKFLGDSRTELLPIIEEEYVEKALNNEEVIKKVKVDDRHMFIISLPMEIETEETPNHAMVVVFHGFDRDVNPIRLLNLGAIFITILVTGIIIFFASRKITAPLRELNENVLEFAKGDFSREVTINRKDEIGQLGESVNYMAKELAEMEQVRRDFVANVSHDLRSPLTSIKGFLVAIQDGTIPEHRRDHYLTIMRVETDRLIKLVNDLLDMTQLESKQITLTPESYNISEQLRRVIAKMEPELKKHQIEIDFKEIGEELNVFADADRMEQVLTNLIQNGVQFSPKGSRMEVILTEKDSNAFITIKDYGKGIDEADIPFIWQRFFKVDKARSSKMGTGIGLSIVKHILDQHGIAITVESTIGQGTTFLFYLPLAEKHKK